MKFEVYQDIVRFIQEYTRKGLPRDCVKQLIAKYSGCNQYALHSILGQEMQQKMKITHRRVFGKETQYYKRYLDAVKKNKPPGILKNLALELETCPALLARRVLEEWCKLDDPNKFSQNEVAKMMKDTTRIEDRNLSYEIYLCVIYDDQYGAISNAISESTGEVYEVKLANYLIERNIPHFNEDHLRAKGYDKTPDCKLELPIAVNGFVVNWIESKAQFGSPENHKKYIKEQFLSYWNRFGPGLVIYWFGFVDTIIQSSETRFIVMDHFPENITYMDPSSITRGS